jgi:hypothetical protein
MRKTAQPADRSRRRTGFTSRAWIIPLEAQAGLRSGRAENSEFRKSMESRYLQAIIT